MASSNQNSASHRDAFSSGQRDPRGLLESELPPSSRRQAYPDLFCPHRPAKVLVSVRFPVAQQGSHAGYRFPVAQQDTQVICSPNYRADMCCSLPAVLTNILIWSWHLGACQCAQLRPRKSGKSPLPSQLRETWSSGGSRSLGTATTEGPRRSWGEVTLCLPEARAQHLSSEAIQDHTSSGHLEAGHRASGQLG